MQKPFAAFQCESSDKPLNAQQKESKKIPRRHKAIVQYQSHHASHVASRAREDKGGKNKITRNEGGAFIIVVKLLRTDTWQKDCQLVLQAVVMLHIYLLHLEVNKKKLLE